NDMQVLPFAVSHDAAEPVGYTISTSGRKIAIATDLGHTDDQIAEHFHGADIILLESNHDLDMLKFGNYPAHLKRRILSDIGHLSNPAAGIFLRDIYSPKTKHIFLAHLSEENNRPILAHETVQNILLSAKIPIGTDCGLYLAPRKHISPVIELE
ncbi:MAG: MBL fold metallo-hydrolase, partial [Defluviitaleaceae bacterium]|nr:MBL fold metallo-hydrolase [Defluviitaleaceae bacterium]